MEKIFNKKTHFKDFEYKWIQNCSTWDLKLEWKLVRGYCHGWKDQFVNTVAQGKEYVYLLEDINNAETINLWKENHCEWGKCTHTYHNINFKTDMIFYIWAWTDCLSPQPWVNNVKP